MARPFGTVALPMGTGTFAGPVTYAAPVQGFAAPVQGFAAPFGAPRVQGFAAPVQGFAAPVQGFAAPVQGFPMAQGPVMVGGAAPFGAPFGMQAAPGQGGGKTQYTSKDRAAEHNAHDGVKETHALVVHVDYGWPWAKQNGWCPAGFGDRLDTMENAEMFKRLLQESGVTDVVHINNMQATKEEVLRQIVSVGNRCDLDDCFLFFYSGHGAQMRDQDGDEGDGFDEALCLPNQAGICNEQTWLRDDFIAQAFSQVKAGNKLLVFDCCHSGTVCDFDKSFWRGQKAVSLCGCRDAQESAGMGGGTRGGAFSKMIDAACRQHAGKSISVGKLFNEAKQHKNRFVPPGHQQEVVCTAAPGFDSCHMEWPLKMTGARAGAFAGYGAPVTYGTASMGPRTYGAPVTYGTASIRSAPVTYGTASIAPMVTPTTYAAPVSRVAAPATYAAPRIGTTFGTVL